MDSNKGRKIRRRKYLLFNSSQPELYGKLLLLFLIVLLVSSSIFYLLSRKEIEMEWYKAHSTLRFLTERLLPWLIFTDLAGIIVVATLLIFFTHRIAGASYRLRRDLEEIRKGDLAKQIRLRKGDQLQDIAGSMNLALESIRESIEKISGMAFDAEMKTNTVLHYLSNNDGGAQAREEAVRLVHIIRRMREKLQSFVS